MHTTQQQCLDLSCSRFLLKMFPVVELLPPVPQAFSSQPAAVPSLGPHLNPHFPAPSSLLHQETHNSGCGAQGKWHRPCVQFLLCPAFHRQAASFSSEPPKVSLLPQLTSSPWMGFSESGNLSSLSVPHQRGWSPSVSSCLFFFFFFHSNWSGEDFSYPFRCPRSSTSV